MKPLDSRYGGHVGWVSLALQTEQMYVSPPSSYIYRGFAREVISQ